VDKTEKDTPRKTVTMSDVAKRAGVSRATVSRLLSKKPLPIQVTEATRQRVFDAVKELGYRPNRLAQSLNTKKKLIIGLSLPSFMPPDTDDRTWVSMNSTSVGDLVCGVQSVAGGAAARLRHSPVPTVRVPKRGGAGRLRINAGLRGRSRIRDAESPI